MSEKLTRREMLAGAGIGLGALSVGSAAADQAEPQSNDEPFRYCLNMGTIMGHNLDVAQEAEVAAKAGYSGIEPWIRNLQKYGDQGNSSSDLRRRLADLGLVVESAIGFRAWGVDDPERRAKEMEGFKRDMDLVAKIGGKRIAAPPAGINRTPGVDLFKVAQRYRAVLELGREMGVLPQLEIWGSAQTLGRTSEAALVAVQADHPDACLLLDAYHMYKGDSGFEGLKLLNGAAMHVFHINDYPDDPPREEISDKDRVYPGDGVAPLDQILRDLFQTGFRGALSLELFNREYWKQDALDVARTGLEKTRAAVQHALG